MNIVLMAGGGGTRLWPLSRQSKPKQFLDLGTGQTLLEDAYERASKLTDPGQIYVATVAEYEQTVKKLLPDVAGERIFLEPARRDTTGAFASIAIRLQQLGQGSQPTIFMWSDHVFSNEAAFLTDLQKISTLVEEHADHIIIVGHKPISPETGLGYFEVGDNIPPYDNVFALAEFKEKPDLVTAKSFVTSGQHFWNLGYFSLKPDYLLTELQSQSAETRDAITAFTEAVQDNDPSAIATAYNQFPKISIEYTLIEKTKRRLAITGDYGWSDIGSWGVVQEVFGVTGDHAPAGHHVHVNSEGNYIYNATAKNVTLIGVKNTIVVVTDDAILVTNKDDSQQVKQAVAQLEEDKKTELL